MTDPVYSAGVTAGLNAAAAFLEGRASMAREMRKPGEGKVLDAARAGVARLAGQGAEPAAVVDSPLDLQVLGRLVRVREFLEMEVENRNGAGSLTDYQGEAEAALADFDQAVAALAGTA